VDGEGSTYALLHEDTELALILNVDELLAAIGRVADVQLLKNCQPNVYFCDIRPSETGARGDQTATKQFRS